MSDLRRFGVAIDSEVLEQFDELMGKRGYTNRSEAFRDLVRAELVKDSAERPNANVMGTVTIVYEHHVRSLSEKLTEFQHCLEVVVRRGKSAEVWRTAHLLISTMISTKGVEHGHLIVGGGT